MSHTARGAQGGQHATGWTPPLHSDHRDPAPEVAKVSGNRDRGRAGNKIVVVAAADRAIDA